ncbi:MAG: GAF domain-containing protein [Chloroflexi bacterium]|nr:MAG: GAF domain-containing protein [Chloroflexota bacterium]
MLQQNQALEEANRTAETLLHASAQFASMMEQDQVVDTMFLQMRLLVEYDIAAVYTLESPEWIALRATWQEGRSQAAEPGSVVGINPQEFPALLRVIDQQKSHSIADTLQQARPFHHLEANSPRGWLGIPLAAGGKVIGLCEIGRFQPTAFSQDQVRLAEGIASQAAVALQNAQRYEQVRESRAQLKTLTRKIVEVQERERRWVAVELHENLVQKIAAILMKIRYLGDKLDQNESVCPGFDDIDRELSFVFEDLRKMAINLRPVILDTSGLSAAIRSELARLRDNHHLRTDFSESGRLKRIPKEMEITLYRIVQEALANVTQHARAAQVGVSLVQTENRAIMLIEDDGVGFSLNKLDQSTCLGLIGMRERAEMIGGTLAVESSPGEGTMIRVSVPLPESGAAEG